MPDYSDVAKAASDAVSTPDFAEVAARGARRRRQRQAGYAAVAALAVVGVLGAVQLVGGDQARAPDPAPDPEPASGLEITRADGSTYSPVGLDVLCNRGSVPSVVVTGAFAAEGTDVLDPERSESALAGSFRLTVALAPDGGTEVFPNPTLDRVLPPGLIVVDPVSGVKFTSEAEAATDGRLDIATASCDPAKVDLSVAGVLGNADDDNGATVRIEGRLSLEGEQPRPVPKRATAIIDDPAATLDSLAVSPQDPDVQAASWRLCDDAACRRPRWAVVVTGDGFRTRVVLQGVHEYAPVLDAAGQNLLVHAGNSLTPLLVATDGTTRQFALGQASGDGPVIGIGSGLHLWTLFDVEHAVMQPLGMREGSRAPETERMNQVQRLTDGSLAAFAYDEEGSTFARSTDNGDTWTELPLDGPPGALYSIVDVPGSEPAVIEGADGATLFPLVAVHRLVDGDLVRTEVRGDARAYVAGHAVLPDGQLLLAVESWSDDTAPGLYVTWPDDWADLSRVETEAPFDEGRFEARFLDVVYGDGATSIYVAGTPGEATPAYRSDDGGVTWRAVPAR